MDKKIILNQIVKYLDDNLENDDSNKILLDIIEVLNISGNLKLKTSKEIANEMAPGYDGSSLKIRGYFSSLENDLCLVIDENDFEIKKIFIFKTGDTTLSKDAMIGLIRTMRHELMHYAAMNRFYYYEKIWRKTQIKFLSKALATICINFGKEFDAPQKYNSVAELYGNSKYKIIIKKYLNAIKISDLLKAGSLNSIYTNIGSYMYRQTPVEWARFLDNILTTCIQTGSGNINRKSQIINDVLKKTYYSFWPELMTSDFFKNNMFFQELFIPSEIASMCSEGYSYNIELRKKTLETLKLIV